MQSAARTRRTHQDMSDETKPINLGTRLKAGAVDATLAVGVALMVTLGAGYHHEKYLYSDETGLKLGSETHQSFSLPLFFLLGLAFWFALALLANRDLHGRTPGQRMAGYEPRSSPNGARLDITALLKRQAFRLAAAPSAIAAVSQGRELQPTHDALSNTNVRWCEAKAKTGPIP
jgi:hypothetical protein